MANLLCALLGHKKALLAFSSSRYRCARCGVPLGDDAVPRPLPFMPPTTARKGSAKRFRR